MLAMIAGCAGRSDEAGPSDAKVCGAPPDARPLCCGIADHPDPEGCTPGCHAGLCWLCQEGGHWSMAIIDCFPDAGPR